MKRALLLALVIVVTAACDKTVVTAPNANVITFNPGKSMSVTGWSVGSAEGEATTRTTKYKIETTDGGDVLLAMAMTHGPMKFVEDPASEKTPATVLSPQEIKIDVLENTAWNVESTCDRQLFVALATTEDGKSAYPESVWATCRLTLSKANGRASMGWLEFHGDGKIDAKLGGGTIKVVP